MRLIKSEVCEHCYCDRVIYWRSKNPFGAEDGNENDEKEAVPHKKCCNCDHQEEMPVRAIDAIGILLVIAGFLVWTLFVWAMV